MKHLIIIIFLLMISCSDSSSPESKKDWVNKANPVEPQYGDTFESVNGSLTLKGSWTTTGLNGGASANWGHDGKPYVSNRFKIYSDQSSQASRKQVAEYAEIALDNIFDFLQLSNERDFSSFKFKTGFHSRRIHIFTDVSQQPNGGLAYRDGIINRALDSPNYQQFYTKHTWRRTLQHEIFHVVEFLLIREFNQRQANSVWMREGGANFGARFHRIQTVSELLDWKAEMRSIPGGGNPIYIQTWNDFPSPIIQSSRTGEYYGFFELTVRYLMDPVGANGNIGNLKNHYRDLGTGMPFEQSLKKNFNVELSDLRNNWWTIMEDYLKRSDRKYTRSSNY